MEFPRSFRITIANITTITIFITSKQEDNRCKREPTGADLRAPVECEMTGLTGSDLGIRVLQGKARFREELRLPKARVERSLRGSLRSYLFGGRQVG